jgi:hypothetical protein
MQFPMFKKSIDLHSAECLTCLKTISIGNKGKLDLEQHLQSATNKIHAKSTSASRPLSSFLVTNKDAAKVSTAEGVLAFHTVIHNISFRFSDCNSKLINKVFNDSAAWKKFSSCRTKTESIIKKVLAPHARETVLFFTFLSLALVGRPTPAKYFFLILRHELNWIGNKLLANKNNNK